MGVAYSNGAVTLFTGTGSAVGVLKRKGERELNLQWGPEAAFASRYCSCRLGDSITLERGAEVGGWMWSGWSKPSR